MISTEKSRGSPRSTNKGGKFPSGASLASNFSESEWMTSFGESTDALETRMGKFMTERPALVLGVAFGLGVIGFFLMKKLPPPKGTGRGGKKATRNSKPGMLSAGLRPTLERFRTEFDRLATDGIGGVRENLTKMITTEFSERPFQTFGTALSLGYGLGGLQGEDLKRGAIRFAKLLAVNLIDSPALSKNLKIENQGEKNEYDQNQHV